MVGEAFEEGRAGTLMKAAKAASAAAVVTAAPRPVVPAGRPGRRAVRARRFRAHPVRHLRGRHPVGRGPPLRGHPAARAARARGPGAPRDPRLTASAPQRGHRVVVALGVVVVGRARQVGEGGVLAAARRPLPWRRRERRCRTAAAPAGRPSRRQRGWPGPPSPGRRRRRRCRRRSASRPCRRSARRAPTTGGTAIEAPGPVRAHAAGLDGGHLDAQRPDLARQHLAEAADGPLRHLVRAQARGGGASAHRGHRDDVPAALLPQHRQRGRVTLTTPNRLVSIWSRKAASRCPRRRPGSA